MSFIIVSDRPWLLSPAHVRLKVDALSPRKSPERDQTSFADGCAEATLP